MGTERERNRIRSRLDELPPEAREYLDQQLADITRTYTEISNDMKEQGWEISKSSIGRYAMRSNAVANRLKATRQQTVILLNAMQDNKDLEASELGTSLLIDGLTRRLAMAEEDFENMPLEKAGRLLVAIQRSAIYKERMKSTRTRACRDVEANIMKRLREQLRDDPELLQRISAHVAAAVTEEAMRDADG